jgi:hypothetical protein
MDDQATVCWSLRMSEPSPRVPRCPPTSTASWEIQVTDPDTVVVSAAHPQVGPDTVAAKAIAQRYGLKRSRI